MKLGEQPACPAGFFVAPFTGAWIETYSRYKSADWHRVAPFTGAWIETR